MILRITIEIQIDSIERATPKPEKIGQKIGHELAALARRGGFTGAELSRIGEQWSNELRAAVARHFDGKVIKLLNGDGSP